MKNSLCLLALGLVLAGCSTPASRIDDHQAAFNTWPAEVQAKVRAGHIDVGFTPEMVQVALGAPDRRSTRTTADGTADVWIYFDRGPKFSFGLGMGSARGSTAYAGGIAVGDQGFVDDEVLRVIFHEGRVSAIEQRQK